jgi:hypothetical protein
MSPSDTSIFLSEHVQTIRTGWETSLPDSGFHWAQKHRRSGLSVGALNISPVIGSASAVPIGHWAFWRLLTGIRGNFLAAGPFLDRLDRLQAATRLP